MMHNRYKSGSVKLDNVETDVGLHKIKLTIDKSLPEKNVYYSPSQINLSKYMPVVLNLDEFKQFLQSDPGYLEYLSQIDLKKGGEDSILDHIDNIKLGRTSRLKTFFFEGLYLKYKDQLKKKQENTIDKKNTIQAQNYDKQQVQSNINLKIFDSVMAHTGTFDENKQQEVKSKSPTNRFATMQNINFDDISGGNIKAGGKQKLDLGDYEEMMNLPVSSKFKTKE